MSSSSETLMLQSQWSSQQHAHSNNGNPYGFSTPLSTDPEDIRTFLAEERPRGRLQQFGSDGIQTEFKRNTNGVLVLALEVAEG